MQVRPQPVQMPQSDAGKDGRADVEEGSKGFSDDGKGSRKGKGDWRKGKDNGKGQPFVQNMPGKGLPVKGGKDGGKDLGNRGGKDFGKVGGNLGKDGKDRGKGFGKGKEPGKGQPAGKGDGFKSAMKPGMPMKGQSGPMNGMNGQMNGMNGQMNGMNGQMNSMNGQMNGMNGQMNGMNGQMMNQPMDMSMQINNQMNGQMMMPMNNNMNGQQMGTMNGQGMNGGMMVMQNGMNNQMMNGPIMMNGQIMMMMPNQSMVTNGQMMNGNMNGMNGEMNGNMMNGNMITGNMMNGNMMNGNMMNGNMMNGNMMNGNMMNGQMNAQMAAPTMDQSSQQSPGPIPMEQSNMMVDGSGMNQQGAPMMNGQNGPGMMMNGQGPMINGVNGQMIMVNGQPQNSNIMTSQNGQMMLTGVNGTILVNPMGDNMYSAQMPDGRQMSGQMCCMPDAQTGEMVVGMMVPMQQLQQDGANGQVVTMNGQTGQEQEQGQQQQQLGDTAPLDSLSPLDSGEDDDVLLREEEEDEEDEDDEEGDEGDDEEGDEDGPEDTPPTRSVKMPQTPEMTPETPPALDGLELPAAREAWRVRIQNASGAESVMGPVWVACAMVSEVEFVHPETQEELTLEDLQSLDQALQEEPGNLPKGFSVQRAYELCQDGPDSAELQALRDAANEELESLRKEAAEETQRASPEQTGDVVQLLSEAQRAMLSNGRGAEEGWVTTKSRTRKGTVAGTGSLFPYSRKFVQTMLADSTVLVWVQRIEQQLLRLVTPAGGVRPSAANPPSAHFPPLAAKRRAMLHEICGHFGLHTTVDIADPTEPPQALRPMLVCWTEQSTCPPTLPSKAVEVFASTADKAFVNEMRNDSTSYESAVYHIYIPDVTRDEVSAKVEAEVPADASAQITDLGGRHVLVQFSSKLAAQKFLVARRQESDAAQWWSGDVAFAQLQAQYRAKQERKQQGKEKVAGSPASPSVRPVSQQAQQQLLEMGFSEEKIASALATASGNVEAAAQALLTAAEQPPAEEPQAAGPPAPARTGKKDNDDWVRASRGVRDAPKKPKAKAKK
jgi:hypothetical protein